METSTSARISARYAKNRLVHTSLSALLFAFGCGDSTMEDGSLDVTREALTGSEILGFDDPSGWSITQGSSVPTELRIQGSSALELSGITYTELTSAPLSTLSGVTSSIAFDLMIPPEQPNPDWYGLTQFYVSIPSQGVNNQFIGQAELRTFPKNTYKRVRFELPATLVTKLKASYSDLRFKIVLNVPPGPGVYRLDSVRFQAERDIDVTYIARTPEINYDASPNVPQPGSQVTWVGHVRNRGTKALGSFQYRWFVNSQQVASGTVPSLAVGAETTVSLPWTWTNNVTNITLTADPTNQVAEGSELNNSRTVRNNALMVGFWVEQSTYNFFDEHQLDFVTTYGIGDGANSWEDWAVRQLNRWNQSFQAAVFPSSPQGGLDRVRLQKVVIVPDCALPLGAGCASGLPAGNYPNTDDHTVDMMWGFPIQDGIHLDFHNPVDPGSPFNLEPSLVHELNHARFLTDSYQLDVTNHSIDVLDGSGNRLFPDDGEPGHYASVAGSMMHSTTWDYAEWEIDWMNVWARQRPQPGWANYNAHFGGDGYMMTTPPKVPTQNRLRILGANGQPLPGARVRVYHTVPSEDEFKTIDNVPEIDVTTGSNGLVTLGSQPFSLANADIHGGQVNYAVNFVLVTKNGVDTQGWLDISHVNVAYFRGQTSTATYDIPTNL